VEVGFMQERIGIVGGSGYIGFSLARYLSQKFEVTILDIRPPKTLNGLEFRKCDVRSYKNIKKSIEGVDIVIHAAIIQIPLINEQKRLGYEVNVVGTQNICRAVEENPKVRGMILAGSWHTIGERGIVGLVNEEFGFRPDKVEERARIYALSKIAQEAIVRFYDEMSDKVYGIIRMGTVLGEEMPKGTAANLFIEKGIKGEPITPFRHSMHRPMLYVDINDICKAYETYVLKILSGDCIKTGNSLTHIFNVYYPEPITVLRLAEIVKSVIIDCSHGKIKPQIQIVDSGLPVLFSENDTCKIKVDISKAENYFNIRKLISPYESIIRIVRKRLSVIEGHENNKNEKA
jgi:UDP-glucose 4-epimerase